MKAVKRGGADGFSPGSCTESTLIRKAESGSKEAFEVLMKGLMDIIYSYISSHVDTAEDIKDILQETMLSVWNGLKSFDSRSSFKTWVIGITRRRIADHYRKRYRDAADRLSEFEDILSSEDDYERINNRNDIKAALAVLDKTEREIVFLAFNVQLTYSEISEIMGIPAGTVKSRMSAIKAKLRKQLDKEGGYGRV